MPRLLAQQQVADGAGPGKWDCQGVLSGRPPLLAADGPTTCSPPSQPPTHPPPPLPSPARRDCALQCGHLMCERCSLIVTDCPLCRVPVQHRLKLYT